MEKDKLVFKKYDGTLIGDVNEYVKNWMKNNPDSSIIIGCDSQRLSKCVKFIVTIVMHIRDKWGVGHGAHVIYASIYNKDIEFRKDIARKLWAESEYAVEAAQMISCCEKKITIHLDYNSDITKYSNIVYNSGIGYVKGMGYEAMGKPLAYAASHVADGLCKSGNKK